MRERVVELALAVIAAADEGADFAGVRVHHHHRHLDRGRGLALLFPEGVALGEQFVDILHANLHGLGGGALQAGIERRVDAIALIVKIALGKPFEQMVLHHVDKVGRGAAASFCRSRISAWRSSRQPPDRRVM